MTVSMRLLIRAISTSSEILNSHRTRGSNIRIRPQLLEHRSDRVHALPSATTSFQITAREAMVATGAVSERQEQVPDVIARVCTYNVLCTMLAHFIITGHLGTFSTIWSIFLSTPVEHADDSSHNFFRLAGGVGLEPRHVGIVMSALGLIVVFLQVIIYPRLSDRFGTLRIWTSALYAFPLAYVMAPYPALVASESFGADSATYKWLAMFCVLLVFGVGRTGVTPATTLLINDCTPHPSLRATIHSIATVLGNLARSIFPIAALAIFGQGLKIGVVGLGFWCLTCLAVTYRWVKDGSAEEKPLPRIA